MADLNLNITTKTAAAADAEAARVYPWLSSEIGGKNLPSKIFDAVAFVAHEIAHNRLLKNTLTRQVMVTIKISENEVMLAIRYDGEPFDDIASAALGPQGIQGVLVEVKAKYDVNAEEGQLTISAGETLYTRTRISFPLGKK